MQDCKIHMAFLYPPWMKFRLVYRNYSVCLSVRLCADSCPVNNLFLVWHWFTIFGTWVYHHEGHHQGQIYRVYDMVLCSGLSFFVLWHSHTLFARECITTVPCVTYIHELCMKLTFDLNIKIIFSPWIWVWQNVSAFWHTHTTFWLMGVSPLDNMLCTYLTFVWPWP